MNHSKDAKSEQPTHRQIPIAEIIVDRAILPRTETDPATVEHYRETPADQFPDLILFQLGDQLKLASGLHRLERLIGDGATHADCDVQFGSVGDLIETACKENARHGRPFSPEERKRAIKLLLADPERSRWGDERLAELVGASRQTVLRARPNQTNVTGSAPRVGRDGIRRRVPKGKAAAVAESPDEPDQDVDLHCVEVLKVQAEFDGLLASLRSAEGHAKSIGRHMNQNRTFARGPMLKLLEGAKDVATALRPEGPCPVCQGSGCGGCENLGWVFKPLANDVPATPGQALVLKKIGVHAGGMGKKRAIRIMNALLLTGDFKPKKK